LVVTLPTVMSTLFPVTAIFAFATTVTSPVSVLTLDPVGDTFAPAVVETVPVDKSTPLPVTEYINLNVTEPVVKLHLQFLN
jgi:hypothetical protein